MNGRAVAVALLLLLLASCAPTQTPEITPAFPERIVSLVPSVTELIFEIGAGDLVIAVTENDEYPPTVKQLPKVGDQTVDQEKLLILRPDLVILDTEFNREQAQLERLGLRVLPLRSRRLFDIPGNLRLLGQRLGRYEAAERAAQSFEAKLRAIPQVKGQGQVFIEIWGAPLMTVGAQTLPNDLLETLGVENIYSDQTGYFQVDPEDVVKRRPSIIILPATGPNDQSTAAKLLAKAGVSVRVIALDGDLFTTPTPRVLQGLEIVGEEMGKMAR